MHREGLNRANVDAQLVVQLPTVSWGKRQVVVMENKIHTYVNETTWTTSSVYTCTYIRTYVHTGCVCVGCCLGHTAHWDGLTIEVRMMLPAMLYVFDVSDVQLIHLQSSMCWVCAFGCLLQRRHSQECVWGTRLPVSCQRSVSLGTTPTSDM